MSELQVFAILCGIALTTTIALGLWLTLTTTVGKWRHHSRVE